MEFKGIEKELKMTIKGTKSGNNRHSKAIRRHFGTPLKKMQRTSQYVLTSLIIPINPSSVGRLLSEYSRAEVIKRHTNLKRWRSGDAGI